MPKKLLAVSLTVLFLFSTVSVVFQSVEGAEASWKDPDEPSESPVYELKYLLVVDDPVYDDENNTEGDGVVVLWHMNHALWADHKEIAEYWYDANNYSESEAIDRAVEQAEEYDDDEGGWGSMNIYLSSTGEKLSSADTLFDSLFDRLKDFILSIPETIVDLFTDVFDFVTLKIIGYDHETDFSQINGYEDYGGITGPEHPHYEHDEWDGVAGFVQYAIPPSMGMVVLPIVAVIFVMIAWLIVMALKWVIEYVPVI